MSNRKPPGSLRSSASYRGQNIKTERSFNFALNRYTFWLTVEPTSIEAWSRKQRVWKNSDSSQYANDLRLHEHLTQAAAIDEGRCIIDAMFAS